MASGIETSGPGMNRVGHNVKGAEGQPADVAFASDGWSNQKQWKIDFYHVATGKCVNFKAFLDSFSDSFSANWTEEQVYGRMDPIAMYQGTTRKISFGWSVPSVSEIDARKNLHKFEHLSTLLYPTYKRNNGINTMQAAPLLRIKFTNLIGDVSNSAAGAVTPAGAHSNGLLGFVDGFDLQPDLELGFFAPKPGLLYPKSYQVNCAFTVLHTHDMGFDEDSTTGGWLAEPNDRYPYGLHKITGPHSVCPRPAPKAKKTKSKNENISTAQEDAPLK